jgi:hypothetical protein
MTLRRIFSRLLGDRAGSALPVLGLAIGVIIPAAGAAVDYSVATDTKARLQSALDAALMAGARDQTANWTQTAAAVFTSAYSGRGTVPTPTFSVQSGVYSGTVSTSVSNSFVKLVGFNSTTISAANSVSLDGDNACILTYDKGAALTDQGLTFNGSPNVAMSGCSIRSNTTLQCNGHATGATASIAAGTAGGCNNPRSNASVVPDIYAALASNISSTCSTRPGTTWTTGGNVPAAPAVTKATLTGASYTEYHVCGDLTLSGTGTLFGTSTGADTVIVVENGKITMAGDADVQAPRTTFVLTGNNLNPATINFPNGNGHGAVLTVSAPTSTDTPWRGVAIYQDPRLTENVHTTVGEIDEVWGPGATLKVDGLVYMPNATLTINGNAGMANATCTKYAIGKMVLNGSADLNFSQSAQSCTTLGMKQWLGLHYTR